MQRSVQADISCLIPRSSLVLPECQSLVHTLGRVGASSFSSSSFLAFLADPRATIAITVAAVVAVALYGSAFTWLGLVTTQAIGVGLLYVVLWEGFSRASCRGCAC